MVADEVFRGTGIYRITEAPLERKCATKNNNANRIIEQKEQTMTTDSVIKQLTKERDNMAHQISNREKTIIHLSERLKSSRMPNQIAILQAQRARQITMLEADRGMLANFETSLAAEIASQFETQKDLAAKRVQPF